MASGLQCPECGHVHPAGLPEIARGDRTFRCYRCYRMLAVPEGWTGRPASRPPASQTPGAQIPGAGTAAPPLHPGTSSVDQPTQMVSTATAAPRSTGAPPGAPPGAPAPGPPGGRNGLAGAGGVATAPAPSRPAPPAGVSLPAAVRGAVWTVAFFVGLAVAAFVLRKMGVLDVDAVIDLYAGVGAGRFGILVLLLPLWAAVTATVAHCTLEALGRRRRRRSRTR